LAYSSIITHQTVSVFDFPWLSPANTASRSALISTVVFICKRKHQTVRQHPASSSNVDGWKTSLWEENKEENERVWTHELSTVLLASYNPEITRVLLKVFRKSTHDLLESLWHLLQLQRVTRTTM